MRRQLSSWPLLLLGLTSSLPAISFENVLYVKVYKTASSTVASVLWRYAVERNKTIHPGVFKHCNPSKYTRFNVFLGHNYCGRRGCSDEQKKVGHCRGLGLQPWIQLNMEKPYLTVIIAAEPCQRVLSSFYYRRAQFLAQVGSNRSVASTALTSALLANPPTEAAIVKFSRAALRQSSGDRDAVQWWFLADASREGTLTDVTDNVLPGIGLVGLSHRIDETFLLLQRLLAAPRRSIIYTSLKVSSAARSPETPALRFHGLSLEAQAAIQEEVAASGDRAYYEAAEAHFHDSIDRYNKAASSSNEERLEHQLSAYQALRRHLAERCAPSLPLRSSTGASHSSPPSVNKATRNPKHAQRDPQLLCMLRTYDSLGSADRTRRRRALATTTRSFGGSSSSSSSGGGDDVDDNPHKNPPKEEEEEEEEEVSMSESEVARHLEAYFDYMNRRQGLGDGSQRVAPAGSDGALACLLEQRGLGFSARAIEGSNAVHEGSESRAGDAAKAATTQKTQQHQEQRAVLRPMYVAVGGIEGSGHHLFAAAMHAAFPSPHAVRKYQQLDENRARAPRALPLLQNAMTGTTMNFFINEIHAHMWPEGHHHSAEVGLMTPEEILRSLAHPRNAKNYEPLFSPSFTSMFSPPITDGNKHRRIMESNNQNRSKPQHQRRGARARRRADEAGTTANERNFAAGKKVEHVRVFNGGGSHPYGQPRSPYRFGDLLALAAADTELRTLDVRIIFFYRNVTDAVLSVLRRGFAKDLELQARIAELDLAYLNAIYAATAASISTHSAAPLKCGKVLLLPYDFMVSHPSATGVLVAALTAGNDVNERNQLAGRLSRSFKSVVAGHSAKLALSSKRRPRKREFRGPATPMKAGAEKGARNDQPPEHRYAALYDLSWCAKKRDSIRSPEECYIRMRGFLEKFFRPRMGMFTAMAGRAER